MAAERLHVSMCTMWTAGFLLLLAPCGCQEQVQAVNSQRRGDDNGALGAVVQILSQHVDTLTAQLQAVSAKVLQLEAKAAKDETGVAFHAKIDTHDFDVLPLGPIILPHVTTRVGTGYDEHTGYFQAPISGVYLFVVTACVQPPDIAWVNIMIDDTLVAQVMSNSHSGSDQGTVSIPVHLNKGQRVHLTNASNKQISLLGTIYTTFSGLLTHAD